MQQQATSQTVHFYDTEQHRILCGTPGHTNASKHAAIVTCHDCLRLLREREAAAEALAAQKN